MNQNDQKKMAEKIREGYTEKEITKLDELRALDAKVKRPIRVFSYVLGSLGAIVMGCGMSLIMTDVAAQLGLGNMQVPGLIIGVVGLLLVLVNYPIHKAMMKARKKKYASEILAISEKITKE